MGIAHNGAGIRDVKWCPYTYDESINRLGILAAADWAGNVLIYSVPLPSSLKATNDQTLLCEAVPLLSLKHSSLVCKILWNFAEDKKFLWLLAGAEDGKSQNSIFGFTFTKAHFWLGTLSQVLNLKRRIRIPPLL
jgi:hypothetical protein